MYFYYGASALGHSFWWKKYITAMQMWQFVAIMAHRRLLWFGLPNQALQVLPLFVLAHAVEWVLSAIIGGTFPGAWVLLAPVLEAALWPLISWLLLAPQRRAPDPDENRPL